jgi:hypothetical protein
MQTNKTKPSEGIENARLKKMLAHALIEAETPRNKFERPLGANEIKRSHTPGSIRFHYRNHPEMIKAVR